MPDPDAAPVERAQTTHFFNEAPLSMDLKNPLGWLLHVRADTVENFVDQLNQLWDGQIGDRTDVTSVTLFSFNPGVIASMAAGQSAEEAMGTDLDDFAKDNYEAIAQGAQRRPAAASSDGSGGGAKGSGGANKFKVADVDASTLPAWFLDKLSRRDTCPECDGEEFWDNRSDPGKGPVFRCANRDCKTSKGYPWGVFEPDDRSRSRTSSRTR